MARRKKSQTVVTTNITPEYRAHFNAMISGEYNNFALFSCFVNGTPTSAIVAANPTEDGQITFTPLFVALTPDMILTDHDGRRA